MRFLPPIGIVSHYVNSNLVHIHTITKFHSLGLQNNHYYKFQIVFEMQKRGYRPDWMVDWVRIKQRWRTQQIINKKAKHKNHTRVRLRFRLTRFGWERLSAKRHGIKYNMNDKKYRNTMKIKFVHRNDLKKMLKQLPGYTLRLRDPPLDNNPNIQRCRRFVGSYFG